MEFDARNAITSFQSLFVNPVVPKISGNLLTVADVEWSLLKKKHRLIGKAEGCAAMERALASSMSKGSVAFVGRPIAPSPSEGRQIGSPFQVE